MNVREYKIGDAAKASGLTVKTIHYYEQIGLIPRAQRRNSGAHTGGNRMYSEADVGRLRFIYHARLLGLGLPDIRELLALADGKGCPGGQPEYEQVLGRHLDDIDDRIRHLLGLRATIEVLLSPQRRPKGEACSWNTCECMGPANSPSPQAERSTLNRGK
ncbi:MAG: MerR family transcriptional regulator [Alphaproteobacteria bacterium]